jgi:hypothetical protein
MENVSYNCSSGQELLLSHQVMDTAFHMITHLPASTNTFKTHTRSTTADDPLIGH